MDFAPTHATDGRAHARVQQPQIIIDFRLCRDGRARIARRVFLTNRNRRTDADDFIDVGLIHSFEKLSGVSGQALNITSLTFCIDRVESEARLA